MRVILAIGLVVALLWGCTEWGRAAGLLHAPAPNVARAIGNGAILTVALGIGAVLLDGVYPRLAKAFLWGSALIAAVTLIGVASAVPPPGSNRSLAPWYHSLTAPNGGSCCSEADCRTVEYRISGDHYEAYVAKGDTSESFPDGTNAWVPVPPSAVLHRSDNPTGRAVMCWTPWTGVLCFVEGSGV